MTGRHPATRLAKLSIAALAVLGAAAWLGPAILPYDAGFIDLDAVLIPPNARHWLGTDGDGRDVLAQLVAGARVSLSVGVIVTGISLAIGIVLGGIAGSVGGIVDVAVTRLIEVMMCFPTILLVMAALAFVGPSQTNLCAVMGLASWPAVARLVRAECLRLRALPFVLAAQAMGASTWRILLRHLLPNMLSPILVVATFGIASAMLAEAALSFLGFGVAPHEASWGSLIAQARPFAETAWWLTLPAGFAIFLTVLCLNAIGESLRE